MVGRYPFNDDSAPRPHCPSTLYSGLTGWNCSWRGHGRPRISANTNPRARARRSSHCLRARHAGHGRTGRRSAQDSRGHASKCFRAHPSHHRRDRQLRMHNINVPCGPHSCRRHRRGTRHREGSSNAGRIADEVGDLCGGGCGSGFDHRAWSRDEVGTRHSGTADRR